ncbi:MAG TPA: HEPN domain-containing protein [Candidatus Latescibacteria bacterium]|nr:HEPN domain-containing protein [Candidatus Latescibacterota bacterium]
MAARTGDWMRQAQSDLRHGEHSLELGDFEWACFAAQQAAEKALKAVHQERHQVVIGHSILRLIQELEEQEIDEGLLNAARRLDRLYIPTRYPNGFDQGAPVDYYTRADAESALADARAILQWSEQRIKGR